MKAPNTKETPNSSSEAREPAQALRIQIDVDLFRFQVRLQAVGAQLAACAGLLVAAPRRSVERGMISVQPGDAGAKFLENAHPLRDIAREDTAGQAVNGVVRKPHRFGFVLEQLHAQDGSEDFFADNAHLGVSLYEDSRGNEVAIPQLGIGEALAPTDDFGSFGFAGFDVAQ